MKILACDTETTGLSLHESRIIQLGLALYDTEYKRVIESQEILVYDTGYPCIDTGAFEANGLTQDFLRGNAYSPYIAMTAFLNMAFKAEAIIAHNGNGFDFPMISQELKRQSRRFPSIQKIDSKTDIQYPKRMKSNRLVHLAIDHGISVDHKQLHSAFYDVSLLLGIMSYYDINAIIERANSPFIKVIGDVPREKNQLLKDRGFRWSPDKKEWFKEVKKLDLDEFLKGCPFETTIEARI